MRRLPPFAPLVAFEAVARLGSFTRAAAELGLTQSAVSHRIRQLEEHFGHRLIERLNPGLRLTARGEALRPDLGRALDLLGALDARPAGGETRSLRVGAGAALVTWWLARRLPGLAATHPGLAPELVPFETWDEAERDDLDLRILWVSDGAPVPPGERQQALCREAVFPVCRPGLLPRLPADGPSALRALPLIHKEPAGAEGAGTGPEWRWASWVGDPPPPPALRVREIGAALAAAAEGAGVALGRSLLVHDALADERLARVLPGHDAPPSTKRHVVCWPRARAHDWRIARLVRWLVDEVERTVEAVDRAVIDRDSERRAGQRPAASARA